MAYQQKPGQGALFKNTRKTADNHPDYTGNMLGLDGKTYWLSAWIKEGGGKKFFSISMKPQDSAPKKQATKKTYANKDEFEDDGQIPF